MLLCCRDVTLNKNGVQEEIGIAEDLVKELKDPRFISTPPRTIQEGLRHRRTSVGEFRGKLGQRLA